MTARTLIAFARPTFVVLCLAGPALAAPQVGGVVFQNIPPPPSGITNTGGPGNTQVLGTSWDDTLSDKAPDDHDTFHDAPGGSDGEVDLIDSTDGDPDDTVFAGPEDIIKGDGGDQVIILPPGGHTPLWSGTYSEYLRIKGMLRWVRDVLQSLLASTSSGAQFDWQQAFFHASADLSMVTPGYVGSEAIAFPAIFDIGPYVIGTVPDSPFDCLNWMGYGDEDPLAATANLTYTAEEFAAARQAVQDLLEYLINNTP